MNTDSKDVFALARSDLQTETNRMLERIYWEDFTDEEVALLAALLRPVYERHNPPGWPRPELTIVKADAK